MALTITEILRAVMPNIGLVVNPDGSYRIGVEDVNSDEILVAVQALLTGIVLAGGSAEIGKVAFKDNSEYLLGTNRLLTTTGEQYNVDDGAAIGTTVQNSETDMYTFTLNTLPAGTINWLEFGLTCALIQVTGAVNGVFKWYIRQGIAGAWTNIFTSSAQALTAAYVNFTRSGKWKPAIAMTYPIQVKLTLTTDGAVNMGKAKVNGVSIVRVVLQ